MTVTRDPGLRQPECGDEAGWTAAHDDHVLQRSSSGSALAMIAEASRRASLPPLRARRIVRRMNSKDEPREYSSPVCYAPEIRGRAVELDRDQGVAQGETASASSHIAWRAIRPIASA